jgi:ribosomal-protein-serine acetyltransferase
MKKTDILEHLPITTERLIIRHVTLNDVDDIQAAKMERAEDMRRWMSWSSPEGMTRAAAEAYIKQGLDPQSRILPLVARTRTGGGLAVMSGLDALDDNFATISTGWWVAKPYEGQGLAFEAMTAILRFAFERAQVKTMTSCYYEGNSRSRSLMERLGFVFERVEENGHRSHLTGELHNVYHYRLEKS